MMYAIFYNLYERFDWKTMKHTGEKYIDAICGSDCYMHIDARLSLTNAQLRAEEYARKKINRPYAYRLFKGPRLFEGRSVTDLIIL